MIITSSPIGRFLKSRANFTKLLTTASKMILPFSLVANVGSPLTPDFGERDQ